MLEKIGHALGLSHEKRHGENEVEKWKRLKDEESDFFDAHWDSEMLDTQYERETVKEDIRHRKHDLKKLKTQIRNHWRTYQDRLETARDSDEGIDELEAKTKAKQAKKAAKDKEQLYKLLWMELSALKNALRKDGQIRILGGDTYKVAFSDVDNAAVEQMAEEHRSLLRRRRMKVEEFKEGIDRTEAEDVHIDFSDIEKDAAELEMEDMDVDIFVESETPEIEAGETEWD
ncbi:hypothetical protein [Halorarum halobium]|uniref:hypothetical protein n=1 Tax=Halorarum halobium TaxID=3075121 RepID=UPI0028AF87D9|nr:hypothetical protein [Halobaculum sp. XH14]